MENNQTYQSQMTDSGGWGGGKLPNANCDQTTKWKITKHTNHKSQMTDLEVGVNYQMQIVTNMQK